MWLWVMSRRWSDTHLGRTETRGWWNGTVGRVVVVRVTAGIAALIPEEITVWVSARWDGIWVLRYRVSWRRGDRSMRARVHGRAGRRRRWGKGIVMSVVGDHIITSVIAMMATKGRPVCSDRWPGGRAMGIVGRIDRPGSQSMSVESGPGSTGSLSIVVLAVMVPRTTCCCRGVRKRIGLWIG